MKRRIQGTCNEKDLVLFHYGELDTVARQRLRQHLDACQDCSARLAGLQRTLAALPLPDLTLSDVEKHRLTAVITDRAGQRAQPRRWMWGSALATGAVLAVSLLVMPGGPGNLPGGLPRSEAEIGMLQDMELLQNIDLLENLELLQELERVS
jgi:anti-sigma factor RsiW